eukprot:scaffold538_cov166-Amphora_coffeaeformis.AAC.9
MGRQKGLLAGFGAMIRSRLRSFHLSRLGTVCVAGLQGVVLVGTINLSGVSLVEERAQETKKSHDE